MPAIERIVRINISQQTKAVAQASFGIPLIVGPTDPGWEEGDIVHAYSDADALLDDGFGTTDPEYVWALKLNAQPIAPSQFLVGRRTTAVAQVSTLAVNTADTGDGRTFAFTLNGVVVSHESSGSDTKQDILTGLRTAAIATGAVTGNVTGTGDSALLTLTSTTPGQALSFTAVDSQLTLNTTTPAKGIAADVAAIRAIDDTWYGWVLVEGTDADILQGAAWTEGQKKMFFATSATGAIGDPAATTDVMSKLKASSYRRSPLLWSPGAADLGAVAAWVGGQLPKTPGSNTWAFKTLAGVPADTLTDAQMIAAVGNPVAGLDGKNANVHTVVGGVPITQMGTTPDGDYIDVVIGLDWLEAEMTANVFRYLVASDKIPYTDVGTAVLISGVRKALDDGARNGLVEAASIVVDAQKVADVPANKRANRIAPTITWACRLQGAVHSVPVEGTVTV